MISISKSEDLTPALAGTIGKIVMTTAIVAAFAAGYGLGPEFIVENVRFEMLIAAVLFVILFSGFCLPTSNLAGCHGPLIPLIPLIVLSGGHPLALGIMVAVFGLALGLSKGGSTLVNLTGDGVRGGLLIYLGMTGLLGQLNALRGWANSIGNEAIFFVIILVGHPHVCLSDQNQQALAGHSLMLAGGDDRGPGHGSAVPVHDRHPASPT